MLTSIIFDFSHLEMKIQSVKNLFYLASLNNSYCIYFFLKVNLWLVVTLKGCLFGNTDQILQGAQSLCCYLPGTELVSGQTLTHLCC